MAPSSGRTRSGWTTYSPCSRRSQRSIARSATARLRRSDAWSRRAAWVKRRAQASSITTQRAESDRKDLTFERPRTFHPREQNATAISAVPRFPPRCRVEVPRLLGRTGGGGGLLSGDVRGSAPRLPEVTCRLEPARVGTHHRSSQGA